jgi:hypothetical protein
MLTNLRVGDRVEDKKITNAAALPLSTASLNLKTRLSRSYSMAANHRSMSWLTTFAKS